jgi:ABC-type sugar transport system ATPase subunit
MDGVDVTAQEPGERDVAMVFQSYALYPHMTVAENIGFPLKMVGTPRDAIARSVADAAARVSIGHLLQRRPGQLSGGQQQRVALARAIVRQPKLFLLDEPLSNLDAKLRLETRLELKQLQRALGVTSVYVTHDQQEALVMSDRIAVMNEGRIEQCGDPTELYDEPATRFVASFIGESNFLDGMISRVDGGDACIETPGVGELRAPCKPGLAPGTSVAVTVRPEKIVATEDGAGPDVNAVSGTVEDVVFVGEMRRYVVALPGGQRLVLKAQNRSGVRNYERGDAIRVAWSRGDCRLV